MNIIIIRKDIAEPYGSYLVLLLSFVIRGTLPGSFKSPPETHSKLLKKRDKLLGLYKSHFNREMKLEVVYAKAQRDPIFARQIFDFSTGQPVLRTALIANTKYYQDAIKDFIADAKKQDLIKDVLGQGVHGLTVLMEENGYQVVVKLPVNTQTDFDGEGINALQNEFDHAQKLASMSDVDHSVWAGPVDQLSIRGKLLAFGKLGGRDLFDRDDYNDNVKSAFHDYAALRGFEPRRIAELIKFYMSAYKDNISTMSYGSPHNTRLVEDGAGIALFDLCSQPPLQEHDLQQFYIQKKLFGDNVLACALSQVLENGNINLLFEGDIGSRFRLGILSSPNQGKDFHDYRERLLRESLEVLLENEVVKKDELITNLEALRDVNDRIDAQDMEYLQFKDRGKLIGLGQDILQRLIDHFKS